MARNTATKWKAVLAAVGFSFAASLFAAPAATVTHLAGVLASGGEGESTKALCIGSAVEPGTTLSTAAKTYARLKFTDGSEITLKPETVFKVENYAYDAKVPEKDSAFFRLLKGGLRTITGLVGKRNQAAYRMTTPTATIGIRGTKYDLQFCQGGNCGAVPDGTYVSVAEGSIAISNATGDATVLVGAGQHAHVLDPTALPFLLPALPQLPSYNPPPSTLPPPGGTTGNVGTAGGQQGCVVR